MWEIFWIILFFLTFAGFCVVSALIAWNGVEDLRQLFAQLKRSHELPER